MHDHFYACVYMPVSAMTEPELFSSAMGSGTNESTIAKLCQLMEKTILLGTASLVLESIILIVHFMEGMLILFQQ